MKQMIQILSWLNNYLPRWEGDGTITIKDGSILVDGCTFTPLKSPSLRPGAMIRIKEDCKSVDNMYLYRGGSLRVVEVGKFILAINSGQHGNNALFTLNPSDVEVVE